MTRETLAASERPGGSVEPGETVQFLGLSAIEAGDPDDRVR
jgi:hypothetical protein